MCEWKEDFSHQVPIEINGSLASIDRCIQDFVVMLNSNGYPTKASCCGHGKRPGTIALEDGRELWVLPNYDEARELDRFLPDIHGKWAVSEIKCKSCFYSWIATYPASIDGGRLECERCGKFNSSERGLLND